MLLSVLICTSCCPTSTPGMTTCGRTSEHWWTRRSRIASDVRSLDNDNRVHCRRPTPKKCKLFVFVKTSINYADNEQLAVKVAFLEMIVWQLNCHSYYDCYIFTVQCYV